MNQRSSRLQKGKSIIEFPDKYVVVDIETTGLDPKYCEIIEIAALKVESGDIIDSFQSLIKPTSYYYAEKDCPNAVLCDGEYILYIDDFITRLTGITNEMLDSAPLLEDIIADFQKFIADIPLIGHNVNFDINFLYDAMMQIKNEPLANNFVDTMRVSRRLLPELRHHRLSDLTEYFNITQDIQHRALDDCIATNNIFMNLKHLAMEKYSTLDDFYLAIRPKSYSSTLTVHPETTEFNPEHPLYQKVCVFTGKLERITRKEAFQIVANLGGSCENNITAKTNYLILGNTDFCSTLKGGKSNKLKKAETLLLSGQDIQILSENVFYDMLQDENPNVGNETIEQIEMFNDLENAELSLEQLTYENIKKTLMENDRTDMPLLAAETTSYLSASFENKRVDFRIKFGKKVSYLAIPATYKNELEKQGISYTEEAGGGWLRLSLTKPEEVFSYRDMIVFIYDYRLLENNSDSFDCCSRFMECSDAKKCCQPDSSLAKLCSYRLKLLQNIIYYGKNRNVG